MEDNLRNRIRNLTVRGAKFGQSPVAIFMLNTEPHPLELVCLRLKEFLLCNAYGEPNKHRYLGLKIYPYALLTQDLMSTTLRDISDRYLLPYITMAIFGTFDIPTTLDETRYNNAREYINGKLQVNNTPMVNTVNEAYIHLMAKYYDQDDDADSIGRRQQANAHMFPFELIDGFPLEIMNAIRQGSSLRKADYNELTMKTAKQNLEPIWRDLPINNKLAFYEARELSEFEQAKKLILKSAFLYLTSISKAGNCTNHWLTSRAARFKEETNYDISDVSVEHIKTMHQILSKGGLTVSRIVSTIHWMINLSVRGNLDSLLWILEQSRGVNVSYINAIAESTKRHLYFKYHILKSIIPVVQFKAVARQVIELTRDPWAIIFSPQVHIYQYPDLAYLATLLIYNRTTGGGFLSGGPSYQGALFSNYCVNPIFVLEVLGEEILDKSTKYARDLLIDVNKTANFEKSIEKQENSMYQAVSVKNENVQEVVCDTFPNLLQRWISESPSEQAWILLMSAVNDQLSKKKLVDIVKATNEDNPLPTWHPISTELEAAYKLITTETTLPALPRDQYSEITQQLNYNFVEFPFEPVPAAIPAREDE